MQKVVTMHTRPTIIVSLSHSIVPTTDIPGMLKLCVLYLTS